MIAMVPMEINLGPLLPTHTSELIVGAVLMILIFLVMWKKVVPAFEQMYEERSAAIQGGMEKAEKAQEQAEAALADYKAQLAEARTEAARIREDAQNQGAQISAEMREQANAESQRMIAMTKAQMEAERVQAMGELRSEVGGLATTLAGRIVGESLSDDERARRTVERFLADLESQTETEKV